MNLKPAEEYLTTRLNHLRQLRPRNKMNKWTVDCEIGAAEEALEAVKKAMFVEHALSQVHAKVAA